METIKRVKGSIEIDVDPLATEICANYSASIRQPISRFQMFFRATFDEEACNAKYVTEGCFALLDDVFE